MISNMKYRKKQDVGLFDKENTLQELLENGNPLPKLKEIIDFERFRDILEPVFENTGKKSNAGRKPSGTRLRIHGADDGRPDFPRGGNDEGKS